MRYVYADIDDATPPRHAFASYVTMAVKRWMILCLHALSPAALDAQATSQDIAREAMMPACSGGAATSARMPRLLRRVRRKDARIAARSARYAYAKERARIRQCVSRDSCGRREKRAGVIMRV